MRTSDELTAAAIAYDPDEEGIGERNVMTYDMSKGTCGVSLLPLKMASLK